MVQRKISGPGWWDFLSGLQQHPAFFFYELMQQHGDVVKIGPGVYLVSHPDIARHIFNRDQKSYNQTDFISKRARAIFGNGMVISDGETWASQRKLLSPNFRPRGISQLMPAVLTELDKILDEWAAFARAGQPIDLVEEMGTICIRLAGRALFRTDLNSRVEEIRRIAALGNRYLAQTTPFFVPFWVPTPTHQKLKRAGRALKAMLEEIIQARRDANGLNGDMASTLIHRLGAPEAGDEGRRLLFDELQTMLMGGYFPVTAALSMFWYTIGQHPSQLALLNQEIDAIPEDYRFASGFIDDFPFTIQVLYESMRLYPAAFSLWRNALADDHINGYDIPKGAAVSISVFNIHRRPDIWEAPDSFDPSRFEKSRLAQMPGHYFIPFGYGARKCIGDHYAMMVMPLLIIQLLRRYRLEIAPSPELVLQKAQLMIPERVEARVYWKKNRVARNRKRFIREENK